MFQNHSMRQGNNNHWIRSRRFTRWIFVLILVVVGSNVWSVLVVSQIASQAAYGADGIHIGDELERDITEESVEPGEFTAQESSTIESIHSLAATTRPVTVSSGGEREFIRPVITARNQKQNFSTEELKGLVVTPGDLVFHYEAPIVIPKYKLVFFPIAKGGCTLFKKLFRRMMGYADWRTQDPHMYESQSRIGSFESDLMQLYQFSPQDAHTIMTDPSWTRAVFYREPRARLLSVYLDKVGGRKNGRWIRRICCKPNRVANETVREMMHCGKADLRPAIIDAPRISLSQFVQEVVPSCGSNPHWDPQSLVVPQRFQPYVNFVGRLETADVDAERLLRRLGAWEFGSTGWEAPGEAPAAIFKAVANIPHATNSSTQMTLLEEPKVKTLVDAFVAKDETFLDSILKFDPSDILQPALVHHNQTHDPFPDNTFDNLVVQPEDFVPEYTSPIVLSKHRLLFYPIEKGGCTVFKKLFRRMMGYNDWRTGDPHSFKRNGLVQLYQFTPRDANKIMTDPAWTRAVFYRDPRARLLSVYLDKVGGERNGYFVRKRCCPKVQISSSVFELLSCDKVDFNESASISETIPPVSLHDFLGKVIPACGSNLHWNPQSTVVPERFTPYINFVGHLETADVDAERLLRRVDAWEYGRTGWGSSHNGDDPGAIFQSTSAIPHATNSSTRLNLLDEEKSLVDEFLALDDAFLKSMGSRAG